MQYARKLAALTAAAVFISLAPASGATTAATTVAAAAAAGPDPLEIFAKHEAAVGYSLSDGKAKPFRMETTSTWTSKGKTHHSTAVLYQAGIYYKLRVTDEYGTYFEGFNGRTFWSADGNGNVTPDIGFDRTFLVTWAVIDSEAFDPSVKPVVVKVTDADDVVEISPPSGVAADVYFNRKTYQIDRIVADPNGDADDVTFSDYQRQGAVSVAMAYQSGKVKTSLDKFTWDAPLTESDLMPPEQRTYATFPASGSATLSFDDAHQAILIPVTINGVTGHFILDTGAQSLFINHGFANRAHLETHGSGSASGAGGSAGVSFTKIASLMLGNVELKDFTAVIDSTDALDFADGLLGYDVLAQTVFSIDFDKKTVNFSNPATFKYTGGGGALIIDVGGGSPEIRATVDGKLQVDMLLDTGDESSLTFTRPFIDRNPGIIQRGREELFVGVGGLESAYAGNLPEIDIGPFKFFGLKADSMLGFHGFDAQRHLQGLIGYEILRRFNLAFDYRANRVYLDLNGYGKQTKF